MFLWKFNLPQKLLAIVLIVLLGRLLTGSTNFDLAEKQKSETDEPVKVAKFVDPKQLNCLAKNIFYEAGSEPLSGQAAVARVVMNRVAHGFGKNPCDVIYQSNYVDKVIDDEIQKVKLCQFSWVCEGKTEPNKNSLKYKQAERVAYDVLAYDAYAEILPRTALFFHNLHVDPLWPYKQVAKIGNHIFYSKHKKPKNAQKTVVASEDKI
jgi:spore germination cell wall hydrolase CwlJ-like protein